MRLVILTGNATRHKFFANTVSGHADDAFVVSECRASDSGGAAETSPIARHFRSRYEIEQTVFAGNDVFAAPCLPLLYKEVNLPEVAKVIADFEPDLAVVYGSSIIKEPLISWMPRDRFLNVHLGISPYYRGSGTNFWPFVNGNLEYVGSTIMHIDPGIDTGDIITHVRPEVAPDDTVHTLGCRVIEASANRVISLMNRVRRGESLARVQQWGPETAYYYRNRDFDESALERYYQNLENGLVDRYLRGPSAPIRLIES